MDVHDLARVALTEKAILDVAAEMNGRTRDALAAVMSRGSKLTVFAGDDTEVGQVWVTNPKASWRVTDEQALLEWVEVNHPSAVVRTISPAWLRGLLARGADEHGEEPPGIALVAGRPALTVRPSEVARDLARSLVQREIAP